MKKNRPTKVTPIRGRIEWDDYFLEIATTAAKRSTCSRASVGAVIVRDRRILATGYNGAPSGMPHCTEVGCLIYESTTPSGDLLRNCWRTIHAEMNAIAQAARSGVNIDGASIYVTHSPCVQCMKVLANSGIKAVFYDRPYRLSSIAEIAQAGQIHLRHVGADAEPCLPSSVVAEVASRKRRKPGVKRRASTSR